MGTPRQSPLLILGLGSVLLCKPIRRVRSTCLGRLSAVLCLLCAVMKLVPAAFPPMRPPEVRRLFIAVLYTGLLCLLVLQLRLTKI